MTVASLSGIVIPIMVVQTGNKNTVKQLESQFKQFEKALVKVDRQQIQSTKSAAKYNEVIKETAFGLSRVTTETKKNVKLSNGHIGTQIKIKNNANQLNNTLNQLRWTMVNVGFALGALAGIAYPFVELSKFGMELESLFTKVEVVTGTAASAAGDSIRELRDGTIFSMQEMGESFLEFTKQGFNVEEAMSAIPSVIALSLSGFVDLGKAVEIVSQVLHSFNLNVEESAHIADILKNAANQSRASVEDFGVAMSYAAPVASQAGISVEELSASLAILTNKGLTASKAGTSLAAMITQMLKPTDQTKDAMRDMGLTFFDAEGQLKSLDIITREWALTLDDSQESLDFLMSAMGRRGARAMANFLKNIRDTGEGIEEFQIKIESAASAQEGMDKVSETTSSRLKILWNDFKTSFEPVAESMNDTLATVLDSLDEVAESSAWDKIKTKVKGLAEIYEFPLTHPLLDVAKSFLDKNAERKELEEEDKVFKEEIELLKAQAKIREQKKTKEETDDTKKATIALDAFNWALADTIDLLEKDVETKQVSELRKLQTEILDDIEKGKTAGRDIGVLDLISSDLETQIVRVGAINDEIENATSLVEIWENSVDSLSDQLREESDILKNLKLELKGVNSEIKELSKPRFEGQLQVEKLIDDIDRYMDKQEFMAKTGVTAQEFIQRALSSTSDSYEDLITSINAVDDATNSSKDSYEAWRETVAEFIRDAVTQGNLLGRNVSGAITKFSTLLLSTSKFGTEYEQQSESVSHLKDAYDIYYGEMTDQVNYAVKEHEEGNSTIYDSAQPVIDALQEQWVEQNKLNNVIDESSSAIDILSEQLDDSKDTLDEYKDSIKDLTKELNNMVSASKKAALEALKVYEGDTAKEDVDQPSMEKVKWYKKPTGSITFWTGELPDYATDWESIGSFPKGYKPKQGVDYNDFLMRPGQAPISFSPQDTIIGVKDTSKLGGGSSITIGDIYVNGSSGDPDEIARKIVDQIRMDTRLG